MSEDHERIDELLAGYVLLSLSGEDADESDRILAETLLPRIHRAIDEVPLAGRTPRRGALVAVAASAVALVALGGLSLVLGNRL